MKFETFKSVVASAPLVSIDLVVRNQAGQVLPGLRNNRPARGYWFVPGGRIRKDERVVDALDRLVFGELGVETKQDQARFLGVYQHFYDDNFSGTDFSTHYVVLGYQLILNIELESLPDDQYRDYRWFTIDELMTSDRVHQYTKDYFLM